MIQVLVDRLIFLKKSCHQSEIWHGGQFYHFSLLKAISSCSLSIQSLKTKLYIHVKTNSFALLEKYPCKPHSFNHLLSAYFVGDIAQRLGYKDELDTGPASEDSRPQQRGRQANRLLQPNGI